MQAKSKPITLNVASASSIRRKLLGSHLVIGAIGVGVLTVALGTTLWMRAHMQRLADQRVPMALASAKLDIGVERSLAALRGWMVLGDPTFKDHRRQTWKEQIRPELSVLHDLYRQDRGSIDQGLLLDIQQHLEDLNEAQWWIEDIAQSSGNEPAQLLFDTTMDAIAQNLFRQITAMIDLEARNRTTGHSHQGLGIMADFRASFTRSWKQLGDIASAPAVISDHEFEAYTQSARVHLEALRTAQGSLTPEQKELLAAMGKEFRGFQACADDIVALN